MRPAFRQEPLEQGAPLATNYFCFGIPTALSHSAATKRRISPAPASASGRRDRLTFDAPIQRILNSLGPPRRNPDSWFVNRLALCRLCRGCVDRCAGERGAPLSCEAGFSR